jgi:hypothetical protein
MTKDDSKFQEYLTKLIELSERKMQIERAVSTVYRAARRDKVSVEKLKSEMREMFFILKDQSAKIAKAQIEKEKAVTPPPALQNYADELMDAFGDVALDDLIGK